MKNQYFTTKQDLFTITFHGSNLTVIINGGEPESLGNAIQKFNQYGIKKICRFNTSNFKFEKISKETVKNLFDCDTHSIEQLKNVNFI